MEKGEQAMIDFIAQFSEKIDQMSDLTKKGLDQNRVSFPITPLNSTLKINRA